MPSDGRAAPTDAPSRAGGPQSRQSHLVGYLTAVCALLIVYASLQPFQGWTPPPPGTPFFLFAGMPRRQPTSDVWLNVAAYLPFGFLFALLRRRDGTRVGTMAALGASLCLSFAMELAQSFLPQRVASSVDLASNALGGLSGALLAQWYALRPALHDALVAARTRTFIAGPLGDLGLTLLGVWLLAHVNPAIPPFAVTFNAELPASIDPADYFVEASEIGFDVVGVGLFVGLLLRDRRRMGIAVASLSALALALKSGAAAVMLTHEAWERWLHPTVTLGIAAGLLTLLAVMWLPRAAQVALCSIALLAAPITQELAADAISVPATLPLFSWHYGQLLNFGGLTQALLLVWPVLVSIHLLALAGRPEWGRDGSGG